MRSSNGTILLGAALVLVGYLVAARGPVGGGAAEASPTWDAERGVYVTGDADTLTFWKVRDGKVLEAHTHETDGAALKEWISRPAPSPAGTTAPREGGGSSCGGSCGAGSCG